LKIAILDCLRRGDHKDFNGGYGTTFNIGTGIRSFILGRARASFEYLPSMNNGYLSAFLKKDGFDVQYIDKLNGYVDAKVLFLQPTLINFNFEKKSLKNLKLSNSKIHLVVFGPLVNQMPNEWSELADTIIVGDFENLFNGNYSIEKLPLGQIKVGPLETLDSLPFPDWSLYDYQKFKQYPLFKKAPLFFIQASRSCPYRCSYCPYIVNGTKYLRRSVNDVIEEIKHNIYNYGAKAILFRDPIFGLDTKWLEEFCEKMVAQNIQVDWGCETRLDHLTEPLIIMMKKAGLKSIKVGIESFDHEQLKSLGRFPPEIKHQENIIKVLKQNKVTVVGFYILGLPDDTIKSVKKTIGYSIRLNTSFVNYTLCTPLPGTKFYEEIKDKIFEKNYERFDNFHPVFTHKNITFEELKALQNGAFRKFYFRFNYLWWIFKEMLNV
jgi:radical SAM superfamily enzyme YgiQ (UPF0313 family)